MNDEEEIKMINDLWNDEDFEEHVREVNAEFNINEEETIHQDTAAEEQLTLF